MEAADRMRSPARFHKKQAPPQPVPCALHQGHKDHLSAQRETEEHASSTRKDRPTLGRCSTTPPPGSLQQPSPPQYVPKTAKYTENSAYRYSCVRPLLATWRNFVILEKCRSPPHTTVRVPWGREGRCGGCSSGKASIQLCAG